MISAGLKDSPGGVSQPRGLHDLDDGLRVIPAGRFSLYGGGEVRRLQTKSHDRPDDIDVTWTRPPVVLAHEVQFASEVFIESVVGADAEAVAHPIVQTPVVEHFVGDKEGELLLLNLERMLEANAVANAPRINLWMTPAPFQPVTIHQYKSPDGYV